MSCAQEAATAKNWGRHPGATEALSQTVRKDLNPADNRVDPFPVQFSDKIPLLADTLTAASQRTQLNCARTPELQKL